MDLDKFILISIPLIILINFFLVKNYNSLFFKKTKDIEFYKPQAFHFRPIPRMGGFLIFFFLMFSLVIFFKKNVFIYKFLFLSNFFFLLGFAEDIKINIKPQFRLFFMLLFTFILIYFLDIKIFNTQLSILNDLINSNKIISSIFVCLCFLFIINGCNFIDGFNGLLFNNYINNFIFY